MLTKITKDVFIDLSAVKVIEILSDDCFQVTYHHDHLNSQFFNVEAVVDLHNDIESAIKIYNENKIYMMKYVNSR